MSCCLCGGETSTAFTTTDRNRGLSAERFSYGRCERCGTYSLLNVPEDLGRYYPESYYELPPVADIDLHALAEEPKLDFVRRHRPAGRLVEIGAGFGLFSRAARNAGYDVRAFEMDARCCRFIREAIDVEAVQTDDPAEALGQLEYQPDVVALWHVMEHLPDPGRVLTAAARALAPGGIVALAMPNPQSLQFKLLRGRWAHVDAPRHLCLIPATSLIGRAAELGLSLVEVTASDPAGVHWNRFGWEYAFRRRPASRPQTLLTRAAALATTTLLSPIERRNLGGTAYTVVLEKAV